MGRLAQTCTDVNSIFAYIKPDVYLDQPLTLQEVEKRGKWQACEMWVEGGNGQNEKEVMGGEVHATTVENGIDIDGERYARLAGGARVSGILFGANDGEHISSNVASSSGIGFSGS